MIRFLVSLALATHSTAYASQIFWWNTARGGIDIYGHLEKPEAKKQNRIFNGNLQSVASGSNRSNKFVSPDVLVLGECMPKSFSNETGKTLSDRYSVSQFIPYNDREPDWGTCIFSKSNPRILEVSRLGFSPLDKNKADQAKYENEWIRDLVGDPHTKNFIKMDFDLPYRGELHSLSIIPIHLMQPWLQIEEKSGKSAVVKEILTGKDNPNFYQLQRFIQFIEAENHEKNDTKSDDRHKSESDLGTLVFGDFNFPRTLGGISSQGYRLMILLYNDLFTKSSPSFPSDKTAYLHLDQAFQIAGKLPLKAKAQIEKIDGSDHYPLIIHLDH